MYSISYITTNGSTVLNNIVKADNLGEALADLREYEPVHIILSCVPLSSMPTS